MLIGVNDRVLAPSMAKAKVLTNATLFSPEMATKSPRGNQEMALSGLIYPICGGEGCCRPSETNPEAMRQAAQYGNLSFPRVGGGLSVGRVSTPPLGCYQCPGNNNLAHLSPFFLKIEHATSGSDDYCAQWIKLNRPRQS